MKGKIDERGYLHLERAGVMKKQLCPQISCRDQALYKKDFPCGDWCPLFGEPYGRAWVNFVEYGKTAENPKLEVHLHISCGRTQLIFSEFSDEREKVL